MVKRNPNLAKLQSGYLFPEIEKRKKEFISKNPNAKIISLGIGDTTEPITPRIVKGLSKAVSDLGTKEGYGGYGAEQGLSELREKIAAKLYNGLIQGNEVFVSDGAKPDTGRLQVLFGNKVTIAVQDPSYPVYVDSSVILGQTGNYNEKSTNFDGIEYMKCNPQNDFFPDLANTKRTDLIFFCNPNNPTGAVATKEQLQQLVDFARKNKSIIIYDSAYSQFISDENLPRSIYEVEGAKDVAIEISSFSKSIGFTGVRLGLTIIPNQLKYEDGTQVRKDWNRIMTTIFNGASNIVQHGGLAALDNAGLKEMKQTVSYYLENARIIRKTLEKLGYEIYGGVNSPYIWTRIPGKNSWKAFEEILNQAHIVTTPGVGFGPSGEGFIRFSAFGHREDIKEAVKRIEEHLK
ncbi:LL-diaminopimelate aminotransferase [Candidatus Woesearchaeota archaeon]|nr:LL-diaminopimelate aminotransferase [Candidatus Woesearchaeota archaeon]|tara:strand:- start:2430 stop:3644 length:1215 start_codon:yes stop_codon:yes gene_type:complete